jgi:hypothetical protein
MHFKQREIKIYIIFNLYKILIEGVKYINMHGEAGLDDAIGFQSQS